MFTASISKHYTMRCSISFFCLFIFSASFAQNKLHGIVTDPDHAGIPAASIYIPDLKRGTVTDLSGNYVFDNLPKGKILVEFKCLGFSSLITTIQVDGDVEFSVEMNNTITELSEVIVTGISHSTELKNNPIPIATVNSKALTENSSTNLIDNISKKNGVNQITTGVAISKPVIRGLGYNRIISLYDGIRQEGQQWGDEHGIEIDEFSVDRVEIIKGAGSLLYGSDGLGGVINFITADPVAQGSIIGKWTSNYQTNNGLIANSIVNAGNLKGLYWQARATEKIAHAYKNAYDGRVFNSGFNEMDFNGHIGLSKSWGYTQLNVSSFDQHIGLVEGDRDANGNFIRLKNNNGVEEEITASKNDLNTYSLFIPRQEINHLRISNTSNVYFGDSRLQVNAGYQRNQRKEYGDVLDENTKNLYFDLNTWNYNILLFLPEVHEWQVSFGTSGMTQHNQNKGIEFLIPEYKSFDLGAFAFVKKKIEKLDIAGGFRVDHRHIAIDQLYLDDNGKPTSDPSMLEKFKKANLNFGNYTFSAGLTYQFSNKISTKFNISRGYRAPNIAELSSNGRHEGSLRYEYGNYKLVPETSLQIDGGITYNSKHVSAEASIFQNTIHNYIYTQKLRGKNGLDSIPDVNEPVPAYQYQQGLAQLRGGEFSLDIHPHPFDWLHFENGFSFVIAENKSQSSDSSKYLPYIPAPRYQSELRANINKWKSSFANTYIKVEYQAYLKQNKVLLENRTETPTPSYQLWNAGVGTDVTNKKGVTVISIYLTVNNIFDKAYQNHLSRLKYAQLNAATGRTGVFNVGRNFSVKVVIPVVFKKTGAS